jgi:hypothetical protein
MRLFSYVVAHDTGFAPNPFHGYCSLACCKPKIRSQARPGDLVVGLSRRCQRLVFVMRVAEDMSFAGYWDDPRFRAKRPVWRSPSVRSRCGDNCYEPNGAGYTQIPSGHYDHENDREDLHNKQRDITVDRVLVGEDFVYFGADGPELPPYLSFMRVTRGHRSRFTPDQIETATRYFLGLPRGVQGPPSVGPSDARSWRSGCV